MHSHWLRCSSSTYVEYDSSSRLASGAPRLPTAHAISERVLSILAARARWRGMNGAMSSMKEPAPRGECVAKEPSTLAAFARAQGLAVSNEKAKALVASGKVKPMIEVYPLVQVNEVRARLEAGQVRYRAVLTHSR